MYHKIHFCSIIEKIECLQIFTEKPFSGSNFVPQILVPSEKRRPRDLFGLQIG